MAPFLVGHATHPDWRGALALAAAQLDAQLATRAADGAPPPTLGFVYFSDRYAAEAEALYEALRARWPGVAWVGAVGVGVCASGVEYFDEPALALMLAPLPAAQFEVFSGARKLQRLAAAGAAETALIHVDPRTPEVPALIDEMSRRTASGYVFGGLASSRARCVHIADGVWEGGLSGVAFTRELALVSRVTQGCQPVGPARRITASERHVVLALDGRPALDCLLEDLGLPDLSQPREALARLRRTLVGLTDAAVAPAPARRGAFGKDTRVRHLIGVDPARRAVAVADEVQSGMRAAFCQRDVEAARRDLVRLCSEIRDEVESQAEAVWPAESAVAAASGGARPEGSGPQIAGAVYVSCAGRGGPHFGGPSAELQIVRRALGDVPLVGFFAGGEIAHRHLYGYTGVLTVFLRGRGGG